MSEVDYGKGRDLSVIWEFRKIYLIGGLEQVSRESCANVRTQK
jgi:hypothetical protein